MKVKEINKLLGPKCIIRIKLMRLGDIYKFIKAINFNIDEDVVFDWNYVYDIVVKGKLKGMDYVNKTVFLNNKIDVENVENVVFNLDILELNVNRGYLDITVGYEEEE